MSSSALLILDIMPIVVPAFGGDDALLGRLARAADAARAAKVPVIYVRVVFRPGFPEVSVANRTFSRVSKHFDFTEPNPDVAIHSAVAPKDGDLLVTKRRVSAFTGSDLEVVLRARGIDTLVLTGVATSGVVLSTLREAADKDYGLIVLSDGCADGDSEVHRVLIEKVFPSQARIATVDEWTATL